MLRCIYSPDHYLLQFAGLAFLGGVGAAIASLPEHIFHQEDKNEEQDEKSPSVAFSANNAVHLAGLQAHESMSIKVHSPHCHDFRLVRLTILLRMVGRGHGLGEIGSGSMLCPWPALPGSAVLEELTSPCGHVCIAPRFLLPSRMSCGPIRACLKQRTMQVSKSKLDVPLHANSTFEFFVLPMDFSCTHRTKN